jgi:hypothetical protein
MTVLINTKETIVLGRFTSPTTSKAVTRQL